MDINQVLSEVMNRILCLVPSRIELDNYKAIVSQRFAEQDKRIQELENKPMYHRPDTLQGVIEEAAGEREIKKLKNNNKKEK